MNKSQIFSGGWAVDSIQFSPETVPEPSMLALLFLGGGILIYVRRRKLKAFRN